MENTSYNPEHEAALENIDFYKKWIKDAFDYESQENDVLTAYYEKLQALDPALGDGRFLEFYGVDISAFSAARDTLAAELSERIEEQLRETAEDLQQNVFDAPLFGVEIIDEEGTRYPVERVVVFKGRVMPVVDGQPYHWPIKGIVFR
jgi:hypothetical protein